MNKDEPKDTSVTDLANKVRDSMLAKSDYWTRERLAEVSAHFVAYYLSPNVTDADVANGIKGSFGEHFLG
jgi:hypothetical protein